MFFDNRLIISYIYESTHDRYIFQLAGGEERTVTREQFFAHLNAWRNFEARRALKYENEYRPLPVTVSIHIPVAYSPRQWASKEQALAANQPLRPEKPQSV